MIASAVLALIKITAGIIGRSQALIADGIESILDVISSILIWGALKYAERPPDEDHPYGHGKMETMAAISGALLLIGAGLLVAWLSASELIALAAGTIEHPEVPAPFTLMVLLAVIVTKEVMFRIILRRGHGIHSAAMETDAWHHRSDALTSLAAFLGIGIALWGGPGFAAADNWAALFSCGVIVFNGIRMLKTNLGDALDRQAPAALVHSILARCCEVKGVESAEKARVRRSGLTYIVDLHVRVKGSMTVEEGHEISHKVVEHLKDSDLNLSDVTVHIEPEPPPAPEQKNP
jgi:cation diffusion facilitator family transporter